jgi:RsiW-degrading membrane proteinase PrsW (M82 family)
MKKNNHFLPRKNAAYNELISENAASPVNPSEHVQLKNTRTTLDSFQFFFCALIPIPIAFLYAIFGGRWIGSSFFYSVFIAPVLEEFFKISGILYYTILHYDKIPSRYQILSASLIAGLSFAVVENMLYAYIRLADVNPEKFVLIMGFRWIFLTLIHMFCSLIASLGIISIWSGLIQEKSFFLSKAFFYFLLAVFIHSLYNFLILTL